MTLKALPRFARLAGLSLSMAMGITLVLTGAVACNRPAVNDASKEKPAIDHANFATSCSGCHESERPAPVDVTPHGNGQDCAVCHRYVTTNPNFLASEQFSHVPAPTSCIACHGSLRPKANPHPDTTADCAGCHAFPTFTTQINQ